MSTSKYQIKGESITKAELHQCVQNGTVDEIDVGREGASELEFPFSVDGNWYWAVFNKQFKMTQLERYGFNDEIVLFNWCGARNLFLVETK